MFGILIVRFNLFLQDIKDVCSDIFNRNVLRVFLHVLLCSAFKFAADCLDFFLFRFVLFCFCFFVFCFVLFLVFYFVFCFVLFLFLFLFFVFCIFCCFSFLFLFLFFFFLLFIMHYVSTVSCTFFAKKVVH